MDKLSKKISVVIPLFNKGVDILDTIESAIDQTLPAEEILIIDDGSTDCGERLVTALILSDSKYHNVRLVSQKNGGVSSARNLGVELSIGEYVAFLDADDIWERHFLEEISNLISDFPQAQAYATRYQKVVAGERYVDPLIRDQSQLSEPKILNDYFAISAKGDLPFMTSSICIEKKLFDALGGFPLKEAMGEDQDLWAKIALNAEMVVSPKILAFYHLDSLNRACEMNCPTEECGFSRRLHSAVLENRIPESAAETVLKYTATHMLHLVRLNTARKNFDSARRLLADPRCKLLPLKYWVCRGRLFLGNMKYRKFGIDF